jgi:hypothetical protein
MISSSKDTKKLTVDVGSICIIESEIEMKFPGGHTETLKVKSSADFSEIKPIHHQIFLDTFTHQFHKNLCVYQSHTNHDGSSVPTVKPPIYKRPWWKLW